MKNIVAFVPLAAALCAASASAEAPEPTAPVSACCTIPALTEIDIEVLDRLNSQANKIGEKFAIRLAKPIVVEGRTLVPAGVTGSGDIVHAAKSRFGGKAGEMIVAARYLDHQGVRIPLRSTRFDKRGQGKDQSALVAAMNIGGGAVGGMLSLFVTGGEVDVPPGTIASARISAATTVPPIDQAINEGVKQ